MYETIDLIAQMGILLTGATAVFLVGLKQHRYRRWGYLLGVIGQPFWAYTTIHNGQYAITAMCLYYGFSWGNGLRNHWKGDS